MESIVLFIKHHLGSLWRIIEWLNNLIFSFLYKSKLEEIIPVVISDFTNTLYIYRRLELSDTLSLYNFIKSQTKSDLKYFSPHGFDIYSLKKQFLILSFQMMGVFESDKMVGYFFIRFFANKKCFVGRIIDKDYRGQGIGSIMNSIMYEIAWRMNFRCLSTISTKNKAVMKAHAKNSSMIVLKKLPNDYLLVEFIKNKKDN